MTRAEIEAEARRWVGVPYVKRGRTHKGLDCLGVGAVIADHFSVPYEDFPDYSAWPDPNHRILRELARWLRPVPANSDRRGCVGVFAENTLPGHLGIFTVKEISGERHEHVVHAHMRHGVVEDPWQPTLLPGSMRLIGVFAMPGMED